MAANFAAAPTLSLLPTPPIVVNPCVVPGVCANQFRAQVAQHVATYNQCVLNTCTPYHVCHANLVNALQQHSVNAGQCALSYNPNYGNQGGGGNFYPYGPYYGVQNTGINYI